VEEVAPPVTAKWEPTDDQLLCRDLQHSWSPDTARSTGYGFIRGLKCERCGARKEQRLDREGYLKDSVMFYPAGYLRPGQGRLTRDDRADLRLRNLR
jgi:hypothetical protein